jgi:hypothetical protein
VGLNEFQAINAALAQFNASLYQAYYIGSAGTLSDISGRAYRAPPAKRKSPTR